MTIRTNSLWYVLLKFPYATESSDRPKTLCSFFWKTLGNILVWFVFFPSIAGFVLGMIGFGVAYAPFFSMYIALGFSLFCWALYWNDHRQPKEKKPDGVFVSYLKAVKSKMCPLIEYEEYDT